MSSKTIDIEKLSAKNSNFENMITRLQAELQELYNENRRISLEVPKSQTQQESLDFL